ncbi:hypothetical protein BOTBODRAFT_168755 [Botryobasidium botryosum FD-172 SS1]|uniref:Mitochondrial distribution and morphology protein family 31/32 n=1 Tax=Botryobasidium botryosum (strain FD-172 SS1) TaxID=930990 RepID=A0A067NBJ4_BOTB1|nr:hypothetical protein BOTBODRAFT_168755 [Botryobasidium botryosum FD-172 SS1]
MDTARSNLQRYTIIRDYFQHAQSRKFSSTTQVPLPLTSLCTHRASLFSHDRTHITTSRSVLLSTRSFSATHSQRDAAKKSPNEAETNKPPNQPPPTEPPPDPTGNPNLQNYSTFFRQLALSVPHIHRPTRDDLLKLTPNFWQRARIRFKWFTIKSFRKFNADDMSAFFSWFLVGQTLWILVGTTTFLSVVVALVNSLRMQEYVARAISDYITSEMGVMVVFESAIVPKWKDSRISFKNVYISRRAGSQGKVERLKDNSHQVAARLDFSHNSHDHDLGEEEEAPAREMPLNEGVATFDLNVDSIDVTFSLWRWLDGKGLIQDMEVKGVRGVFDRRTEYWDPNIHWDPAACRHQHLPGDFELDSLLLEDVLITVYQPGGFRPYTASIFRADMRCLRKQWLLYDFLSAEHFVGQFDNCLFSLHKPQSIGRTMDQDMKDGQWTRMSRFRIDGVNIDHLQAMAGDEGPISWITSGKVDVVFDIKFPRDPSADFDINAIMSEIAAQISTAASSSTKIAAELGVDPEQLSTARIPGQRELAKPALRPPSDEIADKPKPLQVSIDIDLRFRDLKAAVPIFTSDLSYVNSALIRPIVAFINANRTLVPIHCRVVKDLSEFDGAWTLWQSELVFPHITPFQHDHNLVPLTPGGLSDATALQIYDALAYHVSNVNMNRRIKTVGLWSLHMTSNAVLNTLRNMVDPIQAQLRAETL